MVKELVNFMFNSMSKLGGGNDIFPFTYIYKLYEKHLPVGAVTDRMYFHALQLAHDELVEETVRKIFAVYHFYTLIPENIKKREKFQELLQSASVSMDDYDGNVTVTMTSVSKLSRIIYLNLLDLHLAKKLLREEVAFGGSILELPETYFVELYDKMNERELSFLSSTYPSRLSTFIELLMENLLFAADDTPKQIGEKSSEEREQRYDQVLRGVVHSLSLVTGFNYYDDIKAAEVKMLDELNAAQEGSFTKVSEPPQRQNLNEKKESWFTRFAKLFE